ncbi:MAG: HDIG domain-containing protein [Candidatus Omnitrophota bacterium]|nr:HDIG domain-containing protein [Candidatus Omnitrophota bacterium]MDZ4241808.1 HDIG domain-containing protein [Candidatus Omnitrophota bacterium]
MKMLRRDKPIRAPKVWLAIGILLFLIAYCWALQFSLLIPLLVAFLGVYLLFFQKGSTYFFLRLGLLLVGLVFITDYAIRYTQIPLTLLPFYIPAASVAMLTMLLFNDLQLVLVMSVVGCTTVSLLTSPNLHTVLILLLGNLTGAFAVYDARTRGKLLSGGIYVGIVQAIAAIFAFPELSLSPTKEFMMQYLSPLLINGVVCGLVVMAVLGICEYLFGVITNFSLMELSDFNQPLLKRMVLEAPGTYHHSLIVSNMSEAAAGAIGANALLTRVGAYYHDIGKMEKPEYFTENQLLGDNKHDDIEPSMSRLVILNHVKEGVELAKKYKLNQIIIDFIPQHHGTSLIHFFYQKALEETDDPQTIKEENYRYPGPKPQKRETAIVMLADSVEGATRALDEHTPVKINETVRKVINNKFIDGQLDECNLTLKEIDTIASTFTRVLSAMYHGRVKYPEKKNGTESRNPKPADDRPDLSRPDQGPRPNGSAG